MTSNMLFVRLSLASFLSLLVASAAWAVILLGVIQYGDLYCSGDILPAEVEGQYTYHGPDFVSPVALECCYNDFGCVTRTDTRPLGYALTVFAISGIAIGFILWLALVRGDRELESGYKGVWRRMLRLIPTILYLFALSAAAYLLSAGLGTLDSVNALGLRIVLGAMIFVGVLLAANVVLYGVLLHGDPTQGPLRRASEKRREM